MLDVVHWIKWLRQWPQLQVVIFVQGDVEPGILRVLLEEHFLSVGNQRLFIVVTICCSQFWRRVLDDMAPCSWQLRILTALSLVHKVQNIDSMRASAYTLYRALIWALTIDQIDHAFFRTNLSQKSHDNPQKSSAFSIDHWSVCHAPSSQLISITRHGVFARFNFQA